MNLEFKIYEINTENELWRMINKIEPNAENEFIIVGEKEDYYRIHHLGKRGPLLVQPLKIKDTAQLIAKSEIKLKGNGTYTDTVELDIPKEFLDMDIIEEIQKLNEI